MNVGKWLEALGFAKFADTFAENEITFEALPHLTPDDLKELGLPMGPRKIIAAAIADLSVDEPAVPRGEPTSPASGEAERRQLTVMFCDLVGSTAMSGRLDPEEMRDVILSYQNAVAGAVTRFEGHVAKYMGDGVLAYFGFPTAHEDDAERAARAGLSIVQAMQALRTPHNEPLTVRIGIATGLVIVGDLVGEGAAQEEAVVGETPNLAARLQGIAGIGEVVVADNTRWLLGDLFDIDNLAYSPSRAYRAQSRPTQSWPSASLRAALTPANVAISAPSSVATRNSHSSSNAGARQKAARVNSSS